FLDSAGPGSASGDGDRNAVTAMRLANTAARLVDHYHTTMLAISKLRDYEPHDCNPQTFTIDTGIPRKGPPGADRHWKKPGYRDDDDALGATPPPANSNPTSTPTTPPISRGALAGHGVQRSFSASPPDALAGQRVHRSYSRTASPHL